MIYYVGSKIGMFQTTEKLFKRRKGVQAHFLSVQNQTTFKGPVEKSQIIPKSHEHKFH